MSASVSSPAIESEPPALHLRLFLPPDWRHVRHLRDYLNGVTQAFGGSRDFAERCSMCASELLENAVKYSVPDSFISITIEMKPSEASMRMEIENHADPSRISDLERVMDTINEGEPQDSYIVLLAEAALKGDASVSQVGLARVRAEGNSWLRCERVGPDIIRMVVGIPERRQYPSTGPQQGRRKKDPR